MLAFEEWEKQSTRAKMKWLDLQVFSDKNYKP